MGVYNDEEVQDLSGHLVLYQTFLDHKIQDLVIHSNGILITFFYNNTCCIQELCTFMHPLQLPGPSFSS